ncbi:MAG: F0F1 ATP synthase subunit epsilon [Patescibacteria group bacterium]
MAKDIRKINFKIATPEKVIFKDDVDQITLPTEMGEITILPNHIPLISVLRAGEVVVKKGNVVSAMSVSGGFIEVQAEKVVVLADTAERAEEIDVKRAEEARTRAQKAMQQKKMDALEFAALAAQIEKEMARIRVGRKYKRVDQAGMMPKYKTD